MTYFSDILSSYIEAKDVKIYSIAKYCNIDRANMYKLVNGKRNPASVESVYKMADYLQLTPLERGKLIEAYHIICIGYDVYLRRKNIHEFLKTFSKKAQGMETAERLPMVINRCSETADMMNVSGKYELLQLAASLFQMESEKENAHIRLMIHNETEDIVEALKKAVYDKAEMKIEQIMCMNNAGNNILALKQIIGLYECACDYQSYYYYDHVLSNVSGFNLLSSMIVTTEYAFMFSMELEYGILYHNQVTVKQLQDVFETLKQKTKLLLTEGDKTGLKEELENLTSDTKEKIVVFCRQPYILPMFSSEDSKIEFIFSESGMKQISVKERRDLLQQMKNADDGKKYRMLKEDLQISECTLCIISSFSGGCMLFETGTGKKVCLNLKESGLLQAFYDYMTNIEEKFFYSREETMERLKKIK